MEPSLYPGPSVADLVVTAAATHRLHQRPFGLEPPRLASRAEPFHESVGQARACSPWTSV